MKSTNEDAILPIGITLDRFIQMQKATRFPNASGSLSQLLRDIVLAGKIINKEINRAGLADLSGPIDSKNVQGELQKKLDVIANVRFVRALRNGGEVCAIVSEEEKDLIITENTNAKYIVAIDPLDGSSNIDTCVSIGTVFSIYRRVTPAGTRPTMEDIFQKGDRQVAAGYIIYGSSSMLVYTAGMGVNGFTYEPSYGEFYLSHPHIMTSEDGQIYSVNEGNSEEFPENIKGYVSQCRKKKLSARYVGSLVADFHRNLLMGGIYLYPPTTSHPQGKLRLLYECLPLAFIIEQAGGKAFDGKNRLMDVTPTDIHQRSPLYIGSSKMVEDIEKICL